MPDATATRFEQEALHFLDAIYRTTRAVQMYKLDHPATRRDIYAAHKQVEDLLRQKRILFVGHASERLLVQGKAIHRKFGQADRLVGSMVDRHIGAFAIHLGVQREEVVKLVWLLAAGPETVLDERGNPKLQILQGLVNIEVRDVFRATFTEEEILAAEPESTLVTQRIDRELARFDGRPSAGGGIETAFAQVLSASAKDVSLESVEGLEQARGLLHEVSSRMIDRFRAGVRDLGEGIRRSAVRLPEALQRAIFGREIREEGDVDVEGVLRGLAPGSKAALVKNELETGGKPDEILARVESLLKNESELVPLVELVARRSEHRVVRDLFHVLQAGAKIAEPGKKGVVALADSDPVALASCRTVLERMGYRVVSVADGDSLLAMVEREDPDLIVLDLALKGTGGIEAVSRLRMARHPAPVLVITALDAFRGVHEVPYLQGLRILTKPFAFAEFLQTVETLARKRAVEEPAGDGGATPSAQAPDPSLPEKDKREETVLGIDMEKARSVQQGLLPSEIPQISGIDIGASYQACFHVGGDYFDFIPLDDGRLGMVVADVSGKAVSGAMIMVMARTLFRTLAPSSSSTVELLKRVNQELSRDMVQGMFLTAYYAILDAAAGTIHIASSGHNPALFWSEKFQFPSYLVPGGMPLGIIDGPAYESSLQEETIHLLPNDRILFYTDGVTEARDLSGQSFGEGRLGKVVHQHIHKTSKELNDAVLGALSEFQATAPQHDDITLVSIGYGGGT